MAIVVRQRKMRSTYSGRLDQTTLPRRTSVHLRTRDEPNIDTFDSSLWKCSTSDSTDHENNNHNDDDGHDGNTNEGIDGDEQTIGQ